MSMLLLLRCDCDSFSFFLIFFDENVSSHYNVADYVVVVQVLCQLLLLLLLLLSETVKSTGAETFVGG